MYKVLTGILTADLCYSYSNKLIKKKQFCTNNSTKNSFVFMNIKETYQTFISNFCKNNILLPDDPGVSG